MDGNLEVLIANVGFPIAISICYGNEDQIGKVFAQAFEEGVVKREELFIASKVYLF